MTALITKDGTAWEPSPEQVARWQELYPLVNVQSELNAMAGWLEGSPQKRKTVRGMPAFCNSWCKRAQDRGGEGLAKKKHRNTISTRDMSSLDDLSHDFTGTMFDHFMDKFGQVFNDKGRQTK